MKTKLLSYLFIIALVTIFYGCPYSSDIPVDSPKEDVMGKMLGKWAQTSEFEKENPTYYTVTKFDNFRYKIVESSYSTSDSAYTEKVWVAHTTTISGAPFLNMQELGQEKYDIYKLDITDTEFTMFEVTDNIDETFTNSGDFIKFIKKNMNLSFFYNASEKTYKRM
jgi:hypothetical protein